MSIRLDIMIQCFYKQDRRYFDSKLTSKALKVRYARIEPQILSPHVVTLCQILGESNINVAPLLELMLDPNWTPCWTPFEPLVSPLVCD